MNIKTKHHPGDHFHMISFSTLYREEKKNPLEFHIKTTFCFEVIFKNLSCLFFPPELCHIVHLLNYDKANSKKQSQQRFVSGDGIS